MMTQVKSNYSFLSHSFCEVTDSSSCKNEM